MSCDVCGGRGAVYRAVVEGGRAIWNDEIVDCPACYVKTLTGAQ